MSMVIQHNIPALQTYNIVNSTSNALQKSIAKLSSGLRINTAADDAAGLAISEKMRSQVRGLDRAVANTQDGISMIQTAEGALSETHSILQRMRELSVQAANDTLTQQDRSYIQEEIDQLKEEVTRIGDTTQFNKKKLLNGDSAGLWSSSDMETKAIISGGLREVDQFGQKKSIEGNYKIRVKAEPGQGEVQKSDIMTIKHADVLTNVSVNVPDGVKSVKVDNMAPGTYSVGLSNSANAPDATAITGAYNIGGTLYTKIEGRKETDVDDDAVVVNARTGSGTASDPYVDGEQTLTFKLGTADLGEVKIVNTTANAIVGNSIGSILQTALNGSTTTGVTVTGLDGVIAKARELGVEIQGFDGLNTANTGDGAAATSTGVALKRFGSSTIGDLSIKTGSTTTAGTGQTALNAGADLIGYHDAASYDAATGVDNRLGKEGGTGKVEIAPEQVFTITNTDDNELNASVLFEFVSGDDLNGTLTLKATANVMDKNGKISTKVQDDIVLKHGSTAVGLDDIFGTHDNNGTAESNVTIALNAGLYSALSEGSKFVVNVTAGKDIATNGTNLELKGTIDKEWPDAWDKGVFRDNTVKAYVDGSQLADTEINWGNYLVNSKTGTVTMGTVTITTDEKFTTSGNGKLAATSIGGDGTITGGARGNKDTLASFTNTYIGKVANGDVKLRDLDKFWNSEGVMMLDDAKKLTLNQGNGKTADVMLYANDTLDEVAEKINNAISMGLGQSQYVDDATKFATFVSNGTDLTSEAVPGTFVIRSVVPGAAGEITFSGDQGIIDAFSLNTIQDSKETVYNVDVVDEHSGKIIAQNVKTTGNVLHGVIHENVDVEFGALKGVTAKWNGTLNKYTYTSEQQETTLHLADNTTVLQIGANEGEDLGMDIGDMRAHSLGLDGVNVMSHDRAGRSITIIDNAIDKVSTQRAKLGAYQNRLEYTASNLTTASENLTSAESRIRDADMAKEMMQFTKLNIMLQAGNSMLAQANQQPQNVLSLIR